MDSPDAIQIPAGSRQSQLPSSLPGHFRSLTTGTRGVSPSASTQPDAYSPLRRAYTASSALRAPLGPVITAAIAPEATAVANEVPDHRAQPWNAVQEPSGGRRQPSI